MVINLHFQYMRQGERNSLPLNRKQTLLTRPLPITPNVMLNPHVERSALAVAVPPWILHVISLPNDNTIRVLSTLFKPFIAKNLMYKSVKVRLPWHSRDSRQIGPTKFPLVPVLYDFLIAVAFLATTFPLSGFAC